MGNVKITYNGTQLSEEEISGDASISYNGSVIGSCAEGETKTLNCNGLYMNGNVVIGGKTLNCANNIMSGNVVVENEGGTPFIPYIVFTSASSISLRANGARWDGTVEYSTSGSSWLTWNGGSIASSSGYLYLRGINNTRFATASNAYSQFLLTGSNISCSGNIMALLDYRYRNNTISSPYCFCSLFNGCSALVSAPELPATTLATGCYYDMFVGCGLTSAPILPATTLASYCYYRMFCRCKSLVSPPQLLATTVADNCYNRMFYEDTALQNLTKLPALTLYEDCYTYMFYGCTGIKMSRTQSSEYQYPFRIPTSGTGTTATNATLYMFRNTSGAFKGSPDVNTTFYSANNSV